MGIFRYAEIKRMQAEADERFDEREAERVRAFHSGFPGYKPTPLAVLDDLAAQIGIARLCVKDESKRFGLNAFKAQGSSYAVGKYIAARMGEPITRMPFERLISGDVKKRMEGMTLITATDGNHGRGAAWTAKQLGLRCIVYMPRGTAAERLERILQLGAEASITPWVYDECVRRARAQAQEHGYLLVQDTTDSMEDETPIHIMQGYLTMALEAVRQWQGEPPTHVFLQAGVGSMAGALAAFFAAYYADMPPKIIVVEAQQADCLLRTAQAADGTLHHAPEDAHTMMAGLNCSIPCRPAWALLERYADLCVSIDDDDAARAMRVLGSPTGNDPRVISGESGASGVGALLAMTMDTAHADAARAVGLDGKARVLCFSTEGDTDRANYLRVVWDGLHGKA